MKKPIAAALIATIFIVSSCKKTKETVDEFTQFDLSYTTTFTVPAASVTVNTPADFTTPDVPTNTSASYPNNKTTYSLVDEVKLTKFNVSADSSNFDYLKSLTIFIQGSGLPEVQLATNTLVPTGVASFDMSLNDVNLKDYLAKSNFKLRVNVTIDGAITTNQKMKLNQTMHVVAKILK
jgi:hypothetical protein